MSSVPQMLTVKDVAKILQKDEQTIRRYVSEGVLTPSATPKLGILFNPEYIAEMTGVDLNPLSPLERRRLENEKKAVENERDEWVRRYEELKGVLRNILSESSKVISLER